MAFWIFAIPIVILVVIVLWIIFGYNNLIVRRNRVQDAWAQIDVQLKRRYDLIPNLINAVKGYMKYEKNVLTTVTTLRTSILNGSVPEKAQANDQLTKALKTIFAVAENYPDLKASQNFQDLQQQLETTENKISFVRTSYNDYVLDYNNAIQVFPGNVFANSFGFKRIDFFQTESQAEREPVKVDFEDVNNPGANKSGTQSSAPAAKSTKTKSSGKKTTKTNQKGQ